MDCNTSALGVKGGSQGFVFEIGGLLAVLRGLTDKRKARGKRYPLETILFFVILAKLCGADNLSAVTEWVRNRIVALAQVLDLKRVQAPHNSTYSRVLGNAVDENEVEQMVAHYLMNLPGVGKSTVVAIDGKTLRGTIPAGQTRGRHLLVACLPQEGIVLMQIEVPGKDGEVTAAPRLLETIDLRGKVVTGDALYAHREISLQIVEQGGDYVWPVKDNQPKLKEDIALLFEPELYSPGFSPALTDFRTARTIDSGHGRIERRTITVSGELKGYLDWPGVEQVFKLDRHVTRQSDKKKSSEIAYGITSLSARRACPKRLLSIVRSHWGIENGLFYRRDYTLREDHSQVRMGDAPKVLAAIHNLIIGLIRTLGFDYLPPARRHFADHLDQAIALLLGSPA